VTRKYTFHPSQCATPLTRICTCLPSLNVHRFASLEICCDFGPDLVIHGKLHGADVTLCVSWRGPATDGRRWSMVDVGKASRCMLCSPPRVSSQRRLSPFYFIALSLQWIIAGLFGRQKFFSWLLFVECDVLLWYVYVWRVFVDRRLSVVSFGGNLFLFCFLFLFFVCFLASLIPGS